ncbi:MAG: SAM-dependent methyltransferase [Bacteroidota bacterium]
MQEAQNKSAENNEKKAPAATEKPVLYMIPTVLAAGTEKEVLAPQVEAAIRSTRLFFVENLRTARRFVSKVGHPEVIETLSFYVLDKSTEAKELGDYIALTKKFGQAGIISEAGCPGIADPGANLVALAHKRDIHVVPLTGPCSFILALMGSGLGGQRFAFLGYLPQKEPQRSAGIKLMEKESKEKNQTQIFMETPYRNVPLYAELLKQCHPSTQLCIALDLTAPDAFIRTATIAEWRKSGFAIPSKVPAVFVLLSA